MMKITGKRRCYGVGVGLMMVLFLPWSQRAAAETLTVNGNVTVGSCDAFVSTSDDATLSATDKSVSMGLLAQTNAVVNGGVTAGNNTVTVGLGNCLGVGDAAKTPGVKVTGDSGTVSGSGGYLFTSTGTADARLGVVMIKQGKEPPPGGVLSWTPADYIKDGDYLDFGAQGDTATNTGAPTQVQTFVMGASCGDAAMCNFTGGGALTVGSLATVLTFTFEYH